MTQAAFDEMMAIRDRPPPEADEVTITGHDPFFRTPFRIGETVAAVLAATGVAANDLWEHRTGRRQRVAIAVPEAGAALHILDYTRRSAPDGSWQPIPVAEELAAQFAITQHWATRDGRWFLPHTGLEHLKRRVMDVLGCVYTPQAVAAAIAARDAGELEDALAAARACGGMVRSAEEWLAHPQGAWLAQRPVVEIERIGNSPPEPLPPAGRPLSGLRVLDLTRILAGPTAARTLAEHGAEVLMVAAADTPQIPSFVRDMSHGKRSCFLDLRNAGDAAQLQGLAREADVFIDGYRPGRLGEKGFSADALAALRPGIVAVSVNCFGSGGPWADRAGWEQVAQTVTGIALSHGTAIGAGQPRLLPAPLCDYVTGYLGAYGAMLALGRRAREGGSYHVRVSLCQSAMFAQRQGLVAGFDDAPGRLGEADLARLYVREDGTAYGDLLTLGPVLRMSDTPCRWALPTPRLGGDAPAWVGGSA